MSLSVTKLSSVSSSPVSWLWPGRIPRGKVTLLCGDPGLGKSFLTMDLAARVTTGADWPDSKTPLRNAGSVLVLSAEDDAGDTIRPRLEAAGGDPSRVVVAEGIAVGRGLRSLDLSQDVAMMGEHLSRMERPRLIVIDPISAYLGDLDSHNNTRVRGVLAELSRLAIRFGPAVVCVTHLNKQPGGKAVYRSMGSLAFTAAARAVWQVAKHPGDDARRVLALVKANLECRQDALAFGVSGDGAAARVQWGESLDLSADTVESEEPGMAEALPEAVGFLRSLLAGGALEASAVLEQAKAAGISVATLRRARRVAGVSVSHSGAGKVRPWMWSRDAHGSTREDEHLVEGGAL